MPTTSSVPPVLGPVSPTQAAGSRLRPLSLTDAVITGGFWAERQRTNREVSIPIGSTRLRDAGNLENLRLAAEQAADPQRVPGREAYHGPVFMDSDVYKWLEAVSWECAREPDDALRDEVEVFSQALAAAQAADGYLNSFVQVTRGDDRYQDLVMGHEHYCFGHLIQAAVAAHRAFGDCLLWQVALRAADHLTETFGPDGNQGLDGHPVVEMALVELYRESGERCYLDLAEHFVATRGRGTIEGYGREPVYFSDRVPVLSTASPEGHAVRAVYLAAGASDVAAEGAGPVDELADALEREWAAMVESKQYLTGGLGSRWDGEAFGDPYELPPDVAYAETCASIGAVQWAWRRLLATGDVHYADEIERLLLNGFVSGVSLSGAEFFYVNVLQVRADAVSHDHRHPVNGRQEWFETACCPPNVMRTVSQLAGYLATSDDDGVQVHQYAAGSLSAGGRRLTVETDYPWDGRVAVVVSEGDPDADAEWTLSLRVPAWSDGATVTDPDGHTSDAGPGYATVTRRWQTGDRVVLELPMPVRLTAPAPRVDAVRGCRAIERGPLVYAVEQVDLPDGVAVDDLRLASADAGSLRAGPGTDLQEGCITVTGDASTASGEATTLTAVPYCLWANRGVGPMRVWVPLAEPDTAAR